MLNALFTLVDMSFLCRRQIRPIDRR